MTSFEDMVIVNTIFHVSDETTAELLKVIKIVEGVFSNTAFVTLLIEELECKNIRLCLFDLCNRK